MNPGKAVRLTHRVQRLTAPNPGLLTGPGTNTYLVGRHEIAVIDPGPANAGHIQAIIDAASAPIRWILVTHTHPDHSPAANLLARRTGAVLIGMAAPAAGHQDRTFQPVKVPNDGDYLPITEFRLQAIHTPGHASNHLCYRLEDEQILFTGDHIMHGSTVVISPPDGDMAAYLRSLARLHAYPITTLAPGHGELLLDAAAAIAALIDHRRQREQKVRERLHALGSGTLDELVTSVYDDVPRAIHTIAKQSLHAHLIKLARDGEVECIDDRWRSPGTGS